MTSEVTTPSDRMAAARAAKALKAAERAAAPKEPEAPKTMSPEEVERLRAELYTKIADLPPTQHPGVRPGTKIGEGLKQEYVDYTHRWFEDFEARRQDRDNQGRLIWPSYSLKEVFPSKDETLIIHGIGYRLISGRKCFLPDPFYSLWMDELRQLRQNDEKFAKPDVPRDSGVLTEPHMMGYGPIRDRQQ